MISRRFVSYEVKFIAGAEGHLASLPLRGYGYQTRDESP